VDARIDWDVIEWQSPVPGQRFKVVVGGRQCLRLVEFTPGFSEDGWCTVGHAGLVLEGSLTLCYRAGGEQKLDAGDTILIESGEAHAHKAVIGSGESARLLLVEDVVAPATSGVPSICRLERPAVILIDSQPGFVESLAATPHGAGIDIAPLMLRLEKLLVMADCLELPTLATFERPDVNGWLPESLERVWPAHGVRFPKRTYDLCNEAEIAAAVAALNRAQLLIAGAETDVCVLQSTLSLLSLGYEVYLLEDCLFTTEPRQAPAIARLRAAGAVPCTLKTAYYELQKTAAVWDDPTALGSPWERLLPLFGEPESWAAWPPLP
jgi:nicotinamidase-related amidase/quercetin dioxygenase-like cupin family protein